MQKVLVKEDNDEKQERYQSDENKQSLKKENQGYSF